mgnify:CR=1 FL=1
MRAVGVKKLKAKLSEYLRIVKTGESVLVMEHDQVVAEIAPPGKNVANARATDDQLLALVESGVLTAPTRSIGEFQFSDRPAGLKREDVDALWDDLRSERL